MSVGGGQVQCGATLGVIPQRPRHAVSHIASHQQPFHDASVPLQWPNSRPQDLGDRLHLTPSDSTCSKGPCARLAQTAI